MLHIPIRNVSTCLPDHWQAIACTLQTRPCTRGRHTTRICRADCLDVLSRCLDVTRALPLGHAADSICAAISSADSTEPCIRLAEFMEPPAAAAGVLAAADGVTFPCARQPCDNHSVCELPEIAARPSDADDGDGGGDRNSDHRCLPACRLGETSAFRVAVGRYVRVPAAAAPPAANRPAGCHKVCRCAAGGRIEQCQPLPCVAFEACMMPGRRVEHASSVRVKCNVCSCYAGEMTCTKRQCRLPGGTDGVETDDDADAAAVGFTSLPCNCPAHYVPVCGRNGQTFPSACVAKCAGLAETDVEFGACTLRLEGRRECAGVVCPGNGRCVPVRQVCLSVMQRPCAQHVCGE